MRPRYWAKGVLKGRWRKGDECEGGEDGDGEDASSGEGDDRDGEGAGDRHRASTKRNAPMDCQKRWTKIVEL